MKLTSLKLDYDSDKLSQRMKQEIEDILKENNKPSLAEIAKQKSIKPVHFQFIFGNYCDPSHLNQSDANVCVFKVSDNWFLEQNVFDWNGSGVRPNIDGPFDYKLAKAFLIGKYLEMPDLIDSNIVKSAQYKLGYDRFGSFVKLNEYLNFDKNMQDLIEKYVVNLYDYIKSGLTTHNRLNVHDNVIKFTYYSYANNKRYRTSLIFDYHQKPYTCQWIQYHVDKKNFPLGNEAKGPLVKNNDLILMQRDYAVTIKDTLADAIRQKLIKSGDKARLELYTQWKRLNNMQEYEKVFKHRITFDEFCYFYSLDKKLAKLKQDNANKNIELVDKIISLLDKQIGETSDNDKLKWMKTQYKIALNDLQNSQSISVELKDMVRQYLESYSDYKNPLLDKISELNKSLGLANDETPVSAASTTSLDHLIGFSKKLKPSVNQDSDSKEKGLAIKNLIDKRLKEHGTNLKQLSKDSGDEYIFGEYKMTINCLGIFKLKDKWFTYTADERQNEWFNGPYTDCSIIYAFVLEEGIYDWFEDYKFNAKEKEIFVNNHFSSVIDLKKYLANEKKKND